MFDTDTEHTRVPQWWAEPDENPSNWHLKLAENWNTETDPEPAVPIEQTGYECDMTEPKTERMHLPQWDGDPSGCSRDYQQEVRLFPQVCYSSGLSGHGLNPHMAKMTVRATRVNDSIRML